MNVVVNGLDQAPRTIQRSPYTMAKCSLTLLNHSYPPVCYLSGSLPQLSKCNINLCYVYNVHSITYMLGIACPIA